MKGKLILVSFQYFRWFPSQMKIIIRHLSYSLLSKWPHRFPSVREYDSLFRLPSVSRGCHPFLQHSGIMMEPDCEQSSFWFNEVWLVSDIFHFCTQNTLVMVNVWCAVVSCTYLPCMWGSEEIAASGGKPTNHNRNESCSPLRTAFFSWPFLENTGCPGFILI